MESQQRAYLYAAATIVCWSTVASVFKLSLRVLTADELLLYAALSSLLVLALILRSRLVELTRWNRRDYLRSALLGLLNPFLYYLILFRAYDRLPAQEAQTLNFVWPIVLALLAVIVLGQRIRLVSLLAMLVSFGGVAVIATRGDPLALQPTDGWGVILALGSTVIWALYWLYGVRDGRDPVMRLCLNFAFGSLYILLYQWLVADWRPPPAIGLVGAVYVGLFEMGLAFVMWLQALRLSRTTAQVGNLIFLVPFCSLLIIHLVVGEPIHASTVLGLALIVTGILAQQYGERRYARLARLQSSSR